MNRLLASLTPEGRAATLTPEQRLAGIPPEQRLAGLAALESPRVLPDEMLARLPESFLATLAAEAREKIRLRLARVH